MKIFMLPKGIPLFNLDIILKQISSIILSKFKLHKRDYNFIISLYGVDKIELSISSIYIKDNYIVIPTSGTNGEILRYLEFGGVNTKSNKLISTSARQISRKIIGDNYVF